MYEYKCTILRIVDGDTIDVNIDLGFNMWIHRERIRVSGIDAPEMRTKDKVTKVFGKASKEYVQSLLPIGSTQIVKNKKKKKGKYGRILGDFIIEDKMLSALMIENYHAVPFNGQSKEDIQLLHEANRQILVNSGKIIL